MRYTPPPLSRKTKIVILLLVLLIHLLLLIPFVIMDFTFLPKSSLEQKVKELHKKVHKIKEEEPEEWGALQSRAMQMSAPVILVDDPSADKPAEKDKSAVAKASDFAKIVSQSSPATTDRMADRDEEEKTDHQIHDESQVNQKQEKEESKPDLKIEDTPQPTHIDIPEDKGTRLIEQKKENKPTESKTVENSKPVLKSRPQTPTKPKVQPKKPAVAKANKQHSVTKPAQKLSLTQLAQGFVDHMKHEGDYTISMSGNSSAKATEAQLKIGRFLQRIIASVQNSWRANTSHYPLSHPVIASIYFTIVINKNGTLNKVGIDKSSGNQLIDNYIKHIIQDASTSFPAIPDYMSHDICSIRCTLDEIRLPEGPPGYTIRQ